MKNKFTLLNTISKFLFVFIIGVSMVGSLALATGDEPGGNTGDEPGGNTGTVINTKINNPLGENGPSDIPGFIKIIVEAVIYIGIPIIALAIIYTGFLFVSAQGNPEALKKAKNSLLYTLIGAALLLGAFVLAEAIGKTVDEIRSTT